MKYNIDLIVFICVIILLYTMPSALVSVSNTIIGKILFIVILISLTLHSTLSGVLVALLLVLVAEYTYSEGFALEGMTHNKKKKNKPMHINNKFSLSHLKEKEAFATTGGVEQISHPRHPADSNQHPVSRPSSKNQLPMPAHSTTGKKEKKSKLDMSMLKPNIKV
jgi:hypothetical protein